MFSSKEWQERIEAYQNSGKTQKTWCKEQGIAYGTFKHQIKKARDKIAKQFVELKSPSVGIQLRWHNVSIEIDPEFDSKTLTRFLCVLRSAC